MKLKIQKKHFQVKICIIELFNSSKGNDNLQIGDKSYTTYNIVIYNKDKLKGDVIIENYLRLCFFDNSFAFYICISFLCNKSKEKLFSWPEVAI